MHLGPAGDATRDPVPVVVAWHLLGETLCEVGSLGTRTDQRHLPPQHVEKLGQLVQVRAPQEPTDPRHPRIVGDRPGRVRVVVDPHRPKLQQLERTFVLADPGLAEEHRAGARAPHRQRDREKQGRQHQQADGGQHQVKRPFGDPCAGPQRRPPQVDERYAPHILSGHASLGDAQLEEAWDNVDLDRQSVTCPKDSDQLPLSDCAEGDDHSRHLVTFHDRDQRVSVAKDRHGQAAALQGIQKPDGLQAILAVLSQDRRHLGADLARADDHGPLK